MKSRKVKTAPSLKRALGMLDNGGRLYNFFARADDGIIDKGELAKIAGVISDKQKMVLFLEMISYKLNREEKAAVIASLSPELSKLYSQLKPLDHKETAFVSADLSKSAIITGYPKQMKLEEDWQGFVMIPTRSGEVEKYSMIPLLSRYDVYEVRFPDRDETCYVAQTKDSDKLPGHKIRMGGIVKELRVKTKEGEIDNTFLELLYWSEIV